MAGQALVNINPTLNVPQAEFLALNRKFRAFVAGYGAGKTWTLCASACKHYWEFPGANRGYFAPTYSQIRDIYYPTIEEVAQDWGLRAVVRTANKEIDFYSGRTYRGTTICRSMENPGSIVGFKISRADVDEIDVMPLKKAEQAWRKIIARLRLRFGGINGADVGTTPEGFNFVYRQFVKGPESNEKIAALYGLVQASTYDNEDNLPEGYIDSLMTSYPPNLIEAYLNGQFVNMTSGTVYYMFDRFKNNCDVVSGDRETIHVGMDFNKGKMAAIAHVIRGDLPYACDEFTGYRDTPDVILALKTAFWEAKDGTFKPTRPIIVYPDASGANASSKNASESDITLLKAAGFTVKGPAANPAVKDRVASMNGMFCNAKNERRYFVNVDRCPVYADSLTQQAMGANGEPDKTAGYDHSNDAGGYFISHKYPIVKRSMTVETF